MTAHSLRFQFYCFYLLPQFHKMPLQWFKLLFKTLNVGISMKMEGTWHLNFWSIKLQCVACTHPNGKLIMLVFSSILNSHPQPPLIFINDGSVSVERCDTCVYVMCVPVCLYVSKILFQQWILIQCDSFSEQNGTNNDYDDYSVIFFALLQITNSSRAGQ